MASVDPEPSELAELGRRLSEHGWSHSVSFDMGPGDFIARYIRDGEELVGRGQDELEATGDAVRQAEAIAANRLEAATGPAAGG